MPDSIHLIAEAGTNHQGRLGDAKKLVEAARQAGADSVKFQIIYPEGLYLPRFFRQGEYEDNKVFALRRAGMLGDDDYRALAAFCRAQGIAMSASVFDRRGLALLDELDAPYVKIASCDLNNSRLLKQAADSGRTLVISTGMATLGEVDQAVHDVLSTGHSDVVLMHCVSEYPCATQRMNLGFLRILEAAFGLPLGLSDHTEQGLAAAAAVALGVAWIEKHFTLDRTAEGFDHAYAMEPEGLAQYCADVRAVEAACRRAQEKVIGREAEVKTLARRGIYAAHDLAAGVTIGEDDLLVVRPESPLAPNAFDIVVGKAVRRPIHQYEPITWDHLSER